MKFKKFTAILTALCLVFFIPLITLQPPTMGNPDHYMEAEAKFVVYPDGTVGLGGKYNYTSTSPNTGPNIQLNVAVAKENDLHVVSTNTTLTLPPEEASQFPFNVTTASMVNEYSNEILNSEINASTTLPDSWRISSTLFDFSGFPFNSTDLTINGHYANQSFNGTITVHLVPGLTFGDIHVNFEGNATEVTVSDSITVFYNYTLPIPGFPSLNETYLNELLSQLNTTITGKGPSSLYNMTSGVLTCTTFNTTINPIDQNSAKVSFLVVVQGDFLQLLTNIFMGTLPSSIGVPYTPGSISNSTIYSMLNATMYATKNCEFTVSYSRNARKIDFQASAMVEEKKYWNMTRDMLVSTYPPEMQPYIKSMLNVTYCSMRSCTETLSYSDGQMSYAGNYTLEGDVNAEINHLKNIYIDLINSTSPGPEWMIPFLKETDIDISNLKFNFNMSEYSVLLDFDGVKVSPPIDPENATCFRLERFFNLTSSLSGEPPSQNERLKLIVQGGSNETHTVTLFIDPNDPNKVPDPDEFAYGNTMIWNNQSISKLKRLMFKIWEGYAETIYNPSSVTQGNPLTIDAKKTANCLLTLTNISKPATLHIKNMTAPPTGVNPPPETYKLLGNYLQVTVNPPDTTVNATLRIYYTMEQLSELGLDENSLTIFYWDNESNNWVAADTHINTTEHYAWTTVTHLSIWALMGQPIPLWLQPWFLVLIGIIIIVVVVLVAVGIKRRKGSRETKGTIEQQ